jgi:imidazolonepropionase-like amidohydrolase
MFRFMRRPHACIPLLLVLSACKPAVESGMKAIAGGVLIDGLGGPPLTDSLIVVSGDRIAAVGRRGEIPVPAEADKIDGGGKFIVPEPVDVYRRMDPAVSFTAANTATAADAAARIASLAAGHTAVIHVWQGDPAIIEATLEAARGAGIAVIGHVQRELDARFFVDNGALGFVGMLRDRAVPDPSFVAKMRNLRIVFAPALVSAGRDLEIAARNTHALFTAGVPIAVASDGKDYQRELELLVEAGIPPLDVIVAATHNGATALRELDQRGTIQPGKRANLWLLSANPGEDIRNLRRVSARMAAGEWVR